MSVITNYADLQAQVVSWSHRSDLTTQIPMFIEIAEREIFRELAIRGVEASSTGSTSGETIAKPADMDALQRIEIEAHGAKYTLDYTSPNGIVELTASTGQPRRIVIEAGAIRLIPAPDGTYTYTLFYTPVLTPLTDVLPTNWLLTNHSDVYLKGALTQVAKYTKNLNDTVRLIQETGAAVDAIRRSDERKRFPIAGGLQIKPRNAR